MESKSPLIKLKFLLSFLLILYIWIPSAPFSQEIETISLKTHSLLAIPVPNPMDMAKIFPGNPYQVTDHRFVLQFYFNGKDIYGIIFKRDKENSIFMHWCFFRSCEESPYDIQTKIVGSFTPPYDQFFFSGHLPPKLNYNFKGLRFYTVK